MSVDELTRQNMLLVFKGQVERVEREHEATGILWQRIYDSNDAIYNRYGEVLLPRKLACISCLWRDGHVVAFIGDIDADLLNNDEGDDIENWAVFGERRPDEFFDVTSGTADGVFEHLFSLIMRRKEQ